MAVGQSVKVKVEDIDPNGTNKCGNAQYHCNACGAYRVLEPKCPYSETEKQTIGKKIKKARTERQLSLINVANETGFSIDYIQNIESGRAIPSVGALLQFAKALKLRIRLGPQ